MFWSTVVSGLLLKNDLCIEIFQLKYFVISLMRVEEETMCLLQHVGQFWKT